MTVKLYAIFADIRKNTKNVDLSYNHHLRNLIKFEVQEKIGKGIENIDG